MKMARSSCHVPAILGILFILPIMVSLEPSRKNSGAVVSYEIKGDEKAEKCTYFYEARVPERVAGLVNCTWYSSKSCCKRTEVTSVFSNMDPVYGASVLCRNYINYLMCYFCSPDQYKFYKSNKKATVCPDFCDSLYEECKHAGFNKTLFGEKYDNGSAFCQAQNFHVADSADCFEFDPDVFGSAISLHSLPWISACVLILFVFLFDFDCRL